MILILMLCMHAKSHQSCPTLCDPMDFSPPGSSVHGILQTRIQGWGCHALLQRIFLTQELNPCLLCLLHWQGDSLPLAPPGKPILDIIVVSVFSLEAWTEFLGYVRYGYVYLFLFLRRGVFWKVAAKKIQIFSWTISYLKNFL